MYKLVTKEVLSDVSKKFEVEAPLVAKKAQPGQFIILRVDEQGERVPLTIADSDPERGTITIIFQEVGLTTKCLGQKEAGDYIADFVGPLGKPMEFPEEPGRVIAVGGGVGIAPVYPKVKGFHKAGMDVTSIIGARCKDLLILEDEMRAVSKELHVCTDDGSYGHHGFVSDILQKYLDDGEPIAEIIAVGPLPMMRAIVNQTRPYGVKTVVSLNPVMVDGTGMCGACRVTVGEETKFTCVDGPVFDGHQVDFDELVARSRMYLDQEKKALENCRCGGAK
ncbi:sulfide/dihydroorotate dehydrogenase-like FAD/NAD-binding protein [Dethiobacter alkaliphilus]|uniref:Oxidoreductase FAD/NAD(P)-binding domain protein n=1 Tax=Dethiobacter alkaliphilus AHT 1 TaxID=555088 RepID=C0GE30_DETAL|nr:sulfide/dihydroorotate dehydrogenase-like FAD/NAD-binding protein [Dethiobacter alkaliphilus]EEG78324.1 oxidoreductase FAD/NAD(P)-binding domain protein [Dethiobacter alkaliphilus AHT 1]MCW3490268.1 sulfide/dihydroorotate dehydrogenase-like FAD/NAD-binding protein [Dethiobacter alkaliphilus]